MSAHVACEDICHAFGSRQILDAISLRTEPGLALAVVGPNGVGKTTLIRILAGLLRPGSGRVFIGDKPLETMARREIARHLSVVPQGRPQVFDFSTLELVLMGFHARTSRFSLPSVRQETLAMEAMDRLEISELAAHSAAVLSGGELQRALLARTMMSQAPIWLLDEPTASLDLKHQLAVLGQVRAHCDHGGTAIAILHDLALVHRYFDQVAVLKDNRLCALGSPDETLTSELVSEVFEVAMIRGQIGGQVVWTPAT